MPEIRKRISTACQIDKLQRELSKVRHSCKEIVTPRPCTLTIRFTRGSREVVCVLLNHLSSSAEPRE